MKKLMLMITAMLVISSAVFSQANGFLKSQYSLNSDTAINTTVKYLTAPSEIMGWQKSVVIQVTGVKISGTVAGTAQVQASLDGTTAGWFNVGSAYTFTDLASQTTSFLIADWPYRFLRVVITPTGTMSNVVYARYTSRRTN